MTAHDGPSAPARDTGPRSIAALLARHGQELAVHIRRMVRGDDEATADLLQDTMLRAHRALAGLAPDANVRAWLYRIATNVTLNHLRARSRERAALARHAAEVAGRSAPPPDAGGGRDRHEALWERVGRLPARQRLALTLRLADELDYEEIARRLGGTAAAARANVYQATRRLKREAQTP